MTRPTLHGLLAASAERAPDKPAFLAGGKSTSYEALVTAARRFAAGLRGRGLARGDRVALVLDNSVEYLVAYYGILEAGGVVVPLCPDTRTHTLVRALVHTEAMGVVLEGASARYLSGQHAAVPGLRFVATVGAPRIEDAGTMDVVAFESLLTEPPGPDAGAGGDELASIVYTSGTTGEPKGVMLSHGNLVANVRSIVEYLGLSPRDTVAMVLPPYYVYGNSVLHTHLCAGATIASVGTMTFPAMVLTGIQEHRCTGLSGVPSTFARLLAFAALDKFDVSSLETITQAGAAMTPALGQRLKARFPGARIFVMYGQAEAGARLAYLPPEDFDRKLGSAGKAIPGVTLRILDAEGREVPRGTVGEIVAQGDNVMRGYWRDPTETDRALTPHGLRTGDLARMDDEGFLTIVGRESEMIKSGAHRIGPRELEDVIEQLTEVLECAVVGLPDELLGEAIAAFVVVRPGQTLDPQRVMRQCLDHLPRFKVPAQVRFVESLPRTATGKVRRLDLRQLV